MVGRAHDRSPPGRSLLVEEAEVLGDEVRQPVFQRRVDLRYLLTVVFSLVVSGERVRHVRKRDRSLRSAVGTHDRDGRFLGRHRCNAHGWRV